VRQKKGIMGRMCAAAALAITVTVCGVTALAPAASASPAVASVATRSTAPQVPLAAGECQRFVKNGKYPITAAVIAGCLAGSTTIIGVAPHISIGIQLSVCGGFLTAAKVDPLTMTLACFAALGPATQSTQYCGPNLGNDCLNAWGGGPWVNVYTGGDEISDTDQHFMVIDENGDQNGTAEIMFTGSGSWNGQCIGDAYNNSGYADTSLDPCARPGQSAGWGTQFTWGTSGCPSGTAWFYDARWKGYLGPPAGAVNGSHWYLNKPSKVCLAIWTDTAA
jgi:hypothetical protein